MKEPNFDIIVLAHGHMELTIRAVKAIYNNTTSPFHLIVMDDSTPDMDEGTDLTPEWFERFAKAHDNITYVHSDKQYRGSHHIFTEAFKKCKTPFAAVVVNSLVVEPEWDIPALQIMKSNPKIGVLGLKCIRMGTELLESCGLAVVTNNAGLSDIGHGQSGHRMSKAYQCDAAQWAFCLLRVEAVAPNLGPDIYHGWKGIEEFEHEFTMREKGWEVWYCGISVGYHQTLATRQAKGVEDLRLNLENKEIFFKRWGFWPKYHEHNSDTGELRPDIKPREPRLEPVMVIDTTGIIKYEIERQFQKAEVK